MSSPPDPTPAPSHHGPPRAAQDNAVNGIGSFRMSAARFRGGRMVSISAAFNVPNSGVVAVIGDSLRGSRVRGLEPPGAAQPQLAAMAIDRAAGAAENYLLLTWCSSR